MPPVSGPLSAALRQRDARAMLDSAALIRAQPTSLERTEAAERLVRTAMYKFALRQITEDERHGYWTPPALLPGAFRRVRAAQRAAAGPPNPGRRTELGRCSRHRAGISSLRQRPPRFHLAASLVIRGSIVGDACPGNQRRQHDPSNTASTWTWRRPPMATCIST